MQRLMGLVFITILLDLPVVSTHADNAPMVSDEKPEIEIVDEDEDDTADIETETTVDNTDTKKGLVIDGDVRPIFDNFNDIYRDEESLDNGRLGVRLRVGADYGITEAFRVGARLAGRCFTDDCDPEFVFESATPATNGLKGGQFTFDELYLHWFRTARGSFAFGRLQTRFVLRGGVYAKSLDRNDSNNVNVTWTDGLQATYRAANGWNSSFVLQRNARDGTGSIRRGTLDFDDSSARNTYFFGFENTRNWGYVVQRGFDVSYLPASLLKDNDSNGRREDYWSLVGRLAARWPQRGEGIRLRIGTEIGYAPKTPTRASLNLDAPVSGLAWNVVASIMDFRPGHNIGINYARAGAGWFLSPQFRPNEELFEIRYQWRGRRLPLLEVRVRWREEIDQQTTAARKANVFDMYVRMTWEFGIKGHTRG